MVRLLGRGATAALPASLSLSAPSIPARAPTLRRCIRCSSPLPALGPHTFRARPLSTSSSPSSTPSAEEDPLAALRAQWPSTLPSPSRSPPAPARPAVIPRPPTAQAQRPVPASSTRNPRPFAPASTPASAFASSSATSASAYSPSSPRPSSAFAMSAAEARALALAQREAMREQQRADRSEEERTAAAAAASASRAASRLPPLLDERGRVPSTQPPTSTAPSTTSTSPSSTSSPASQLNPFNPLVSPSSSSTEELSEEDKAGHLALIDELTDYLRTFRHPTSDKVAPSLTSPSSTIVYADFFYDRPHTTATYNQFIGNHALHGAVDAGLGVPQLMVRRGVPMDVDTFSALVQVCGSAPPSTAQSRREELTRRAGELLVELKAQRLSPSLRFFNSLLEAWTRLGATSRALIVPSMIAEHGLTVSALTYTSLLSLYRDPSVSFDQLREWWSSVRGADGGVDVVAYNAMIRAAAHHGEAEFALQLFGSLQAEGLQPSAYTYNSLMYACSKRPDFYLKAFDLYQQAIALQYQPDAVMMGTLLYACAINSDLSNAIRIFEQMEVAKVPRDTIAYNCLLQCIANTQMRLKQPLAGTEAQLSQADRMDMSERLLIQMEASDVRIDDRTIYLALKVYTNAGRLRVAEEKREELIRRYVRSSEEEQREQGKGHFSQHLWLLMLTMYCRARRLHDCKRVIDRMDSLGVQLSPRAFDPLLRLCGVKADSEFGSALLQRMRQLNLRPADERLERLFDVQLFRQHRRAQSEQRKEGAVPALDESERQRIRDSAWFGASKAKPRAQEQSTPAGDRRARWQPSNMERRAVDRESRDRRRREKTLQEEAL